MMVINSVHVRISTYGIQIKCRATWSVPWSRMQVQFKQMETVNVTVASIGMTQKNSAKNQMLESE